MLSTLAILLAVQSKPTPAETAVQIPESNYRGVNLPFYYPQVSQQTYDASSSFLSTTEAEDMESGRQEIMKQLGIKGDDFVITQSHRDNAGVFHMYVTEKMNGITVDNHNAAVHIQNGAVLAFSSSFTSTQSKLLTRSIAVASPSPPMTVEEAVDIASSQFGAPQDSFPPKLVYVTIPNGDLVLAHQFQLRDDEKSLWYQISVDATSGKVVQAIDYYSDLTIKAVPLPKLQATDGFDVIEESFHAQSSPKGWNSDENRDYTDTQGNNVISAINGVAASGGENLDFSDYTWNAAQEPTTTDNKKASIVNNFYLGNVIHDITYQYGFDEASGNFQTSNFGKGGKGNDRVIIKNQASGTNNANFATPPDGQSGIMQMYLWTRTTPRRDGSLENDIPIHEYTHGISNRLTGGASSANCLRTTTAGGMGEGWSDIIAIYMTRVPSETRDLNVVLGAYAINDSKGIRSKPYSTDMKINPYTLSYVKTQNEVHRIGEYWANTLYEMYWNLVDAQGFSTNLYDAKQLKGNVIALQLVIAGFKIQPCSPTFITARDAILAAEQAYYKGAYKCLVWKAFAKRGLGVDAIEAGFQDGFALPEDCQ